MAKKSTALQWIVREAKKLRREYPRRFDTWREYVAQASAIYSSKHHGHSPVGHKHPKKKSMPLKRAKRKTSRLTHRRVHHRPHRARVGGESGVSTRSRTHTDYNRNKVNITVGAVRKHKKAAREKLEHLIGKEEVLKFKAKKVRQKKKHAKKIAAYKSDYRRLSI